MYPLLLIGTGIAILLKELFSADNELKKISTDHIYCDYLNKHYKKTHEGALKANITKSINKIVEQYKGFKIGKTGNPPVRNLNHKEYSEMFLLCESKNPEFIYTLESTYNNKFIEHKKNDNKKVGGGIQPDILPKLANDSRAENGFLSRFIFAYPDLQEKQNYSKKKLKPETIINYYKYLFFKLRHINSFISCSAHPFFHLANKSSDAVYILVAPTSTIKVMPNEH